MDVASVITRLLHITSEQQTDVKDQKIDVKV